MPAGALSIPVVVLAIICCFVVSAATETPSGECFASYGCWGGLDKKRQRRVAQAMGKIAAEIPFKFVVAAGDNFYKKGVKSPEDPRFIETFESVYDHPSLMHTRWYVALGNHDYRGNFLAQVNYTQMSERWYMPHTYYYDVVLDNKMLLVVLDCPLLERCAVNKPGSPRCWDHDQQQNWTRSVLRKHQSVPFKAVVCHYPMFANGPHVNHKWLVSFLQPLMEQYGAQLYINADNHYIMVARVNGVDYVNSGGGAGYLMHTRLDKGYKRLPETTFEEITDGFIVHCLRPASGTFRNFVYNEEAKLLHMWETESRSSIASLHKKDVELPVVATRPQSVEVESTTRATRRAKRTPQPTSEPVEQIVFTEKLTPVVSGDNNNTPSGISVGHATPLVVGVVIGVIAALMSRRRRRGRK